MVPEAIPWSVLITALVGFLTAATAALLAYSARLKALKEEQVKTQEVLSDTKTAADKAAEASHGVTVTMDGYVKMIVSAAEKVAFAAGEIAEKKRADTADAGEQAAVSAARARDAERKMPAAQLAPQPASPVVPEVKIEAEHVEVKTKEGKKP